MIFLKLKLLFINISSKQLEFIIDLLVCDLIFVKLQIIYLITDCLLSTSN